MKVTVRQFDDKGNIVLETNDLGVADYITPKEGLFDTMQIVYSPDTLNSFPELLLQNR